MAPTETWLIALADMQEGLAELRALCLDLHSVVWCDVGHYLRRRWKLPKLSGLLVAPVRVAWRRDFNFISVDRFGRNV